MRLYNWQLIEAEQLNPKISRKVVHAERMTICRISLSQGAIVQMHSHENEQVTLVESGALKFIFPDSEKIVQAGEILDIPPNLPHRVEALQDSVATDLFSPIRIDWIRGDDAYLRG